MNKYIQYGGGEPFKGPPYQLGYGLGGSFRKFFKWIVPLVKQHALPQIQSGISDIGRTAMSSVSDFARDVADGRDLKTSANTHASRAISAVKEKIEKKLSGGKRKRKTRVTRKKPKFILAKQSKKFDDIFV